MSKGSERVAEWRKAKIAEGYKQKALLLSPAAVKKLAALKKRFELPSEAEVVELALKELAGKANKGFPREE